MSDDEIARLRAIAAKDQAAAKRAILDAAATAIVIEVFPHPCEMAALVDGRSLPLLSLQCLSPDGLDIGDDLAFCSAIKPAVEPGQWQFTIRLSGKGDVFGVCQNSVRPVHLTVHNFQLNMTLVSFGGKLSSVSSRDGTIEARVESYDVSLVG